MAHERAFVLVVDKDGENLEKFRAGLRGKGAVLAVESAEEALSALAAREVAAVVAEQSLEGFSGLELLEKAAQISPPTVGILMSDAPEPSLLMNALNSGVVCRFLKKPLEPVEIDESLDAAMEKYRARLRREEHLTSLRELIDCYKAGPAQSRPAETVLGADDDIKEIMEKIRDIVSYHFSVLSPEEKGVPHSTKLPLKLADVERDEIAAALKKAKGKKSEVARLLGINRSTLYYRMKKLGIPDPSDK